MDIDDPTQTLAERRGRREHRRPPKRYRSDSPAVLPPPLPRPHCDIQPDPPAALPPPLQPLPSSTLARPIVSPSALLVPVRKILKSRTNIFGLFRQYHATQFPAHDPDENTTSGDMMDTYPAASSSIPADLYHPYPTRTSFLLGEWYWNDGVTKSQSSFKNLLEIVSNPDFRPEDVMGINWRRIDAQLGGTVLDDDNWEDEHISSWVKTKVKINVPFHRRTLRPGREEFDAGVLYHRRLVSVIREKLLRPSTFHHLHLEPYELYLQLNKASKPVRVHGELYSSEAFINAHNDLQESPGEPGCDLPRVIVGLMFASDGTQLTAFRNNKLWPVYLAIGNESKYRRAKPSCQAFEHIAYFEAVGIDSALHVKHLKFLIASR
jgi:Plavaka transposase